MSSDTPITDAVGRAHGLAWFGLNAPIDRNLDGLVKYRDCAEKLERSLTTKTAELEALRVELEACRRERDEAKALFNKLADTVEQKCDEAIKGGEPCQHRNYRCINDHALYDRMECKDCGQRWDVEIAE